MKRYSNDLRKRAILLVIEENRKQVDVTSLFGIHKATLFRWVSHYRRTKDFAGSKSNSMGRKHKITSLEMKKFEEFVEEHKNFDFKSMAEKWKGVSFMTIWRTLKRLNFSYKKILVI